MAWVLSIEPNTGVWLWLQLHVGFDEAESTYGPLNTAQGVDGVLRQHQMFCRMNFCTSGGQDSNVMRLPRWRPVRNV